jgi:hypothetical protein
VVLDIPYLGLAMATLRSNIIPIGIVIAALLGIYLLLRKMREKSEKRKETILSTDEPVDTYVISG